VNITRATALENEEIERHLKMTPSANTTLPTPFSTMAWEALHDKSGKFVGQDVAVAIVAHLLEQLQTAQEK
jgi:hypothetical protein